MRLLNTRTLELIGPGHQNQKPLRWNQLRGSNRLVTKARTLLSKKKPSAPPVADTDPTISKSFLASSTGSTSDIDSVASAMASSFPAVAPGPQANEHRPSSKGVASTTVDVTEEPMTSADTDRSDDSDTAHIKGALQTDPGLKSRPPSWITTALSSIIPASASTLSIPAKGEAWMFANLQWDNEQPGRPRVFMTTLVRSLTPKGSKQRKLRELRKKKSSANRRDPLALRANSDEKEMLKKALPPPTDLIPDRHLQSPSTEGAEDSPLSTVAPCQQHKHGDDHQSTTSNKRPRKASGQESQGSKRSKGKQPEKRELDDDGNDDIDDDGPDNNPPNPGGRRQPDGNREFACHYYRRYPIRHRGCLFRHTIRGTNYCKQHLRRCHAPPIHCPVCGVKFAKQSLLDAHGRARSCQRRPFQHPGMTHVQQEAIARVRNEGDAVERWYLIWDILFPGEPRPASPYLDDPSVEMARYHLGEWLEGGGPEGLAGMGLSAEQWRRVTENMVQHIDGQVREALGAGASREASRAEQLSQQDSFSSYDVVEQAPGNYPVAPLQGQPGPSAMQPSASQGTLQGDYVHAQQQQPPPQQYRQQYQQQMQQQYQQQQQQHQRQYQQQLQQQQQQHPQNHPATAPRGRGSNTALASVTQPTPGNTAPSAYYQPTAGPSTMPSGPGPQMALGPMAQPTPSNAASFAFNYYPAGAGPSAATAGPSFSPDDFFWASQHQGPMLPQLQNSEVDPFDTFLVPLPEDDQHPLPEDDQDPSLGNGGPSGFGPPYGGGSNPAPWNGSPGFL